MGADYDGLDDITARTKRPNSFMPAMVGVDRVELEIDAMADNTIEKMEPGGDPVVVRLRCVSQDVCRVPESVTINANESYTYIPVTGVGLGSTQIEATAEGMTGR